MKLATLDDGTRDGQLAVVSRDLKTAHIADGIAPTLQAALDDWAFIAPQLAALYEQLNAGQGRRIFDFDPANCLAPLPRAHGWASAAAYPHGAELERNAVAAGLPAPDALEPLMSAGTGTLLGPRADLVLAHQEWGIDFGAGLAAIVDDVPMGATPDEAHGRIRLLALVNEVTLRQLVIDERDKGAGYLQSRPATAFSPVAVTPDELGDAWRGGKLHLPLLSSWNGTAVGKPDAGVDMAFNFPQLVAHLCRSRRAGAGTIVSAGPVSNRDGGRRGAAPGYGCIAEQRWREMIADGLPTTAFMQHGDTVRIEMLDERGKSVFGAIEQVLKVGGGA